MLAECWDELCGSGGFQAELAIEGPNTGRLDVRVRWPASTLERANAAARHFAEHVKMAFDGAILAAALSTSDAVEEHDRSTCRMPLA